MAITYWHIAISIFLCLWTTFWFYKKFTKKKILQNYDDILKIIEQTKPFPIGPGQHWTLLDVWHDQRIWHKCLKPQADGNKTGLCLDPVYGCCNKVKGTPQTVLRVVSDSSTFREWRSTISDVKQLSPITDRTSSSSNGLTPIIKASTKKSHKPTESVYSQSDIISGTDEFTDNSFIRTMYTVVNYCKKKAVLKKTYIINRIWGKEENGCCWYLEMNHELQEWVFILIQPVEKWFEKKQCLTTVIFHPNASRPSADRSIPANILTGLQIYQLFHKIQPTPLVNLTLKKGDKSVTNSKEDITDTKNPEPAVTATAKARIIFEDVISKFNKPAAPATTTTTDEPKTESKFVSKFRSLIEEKKEWYEEKKRQAAIKASESSAKAKEEIDSILDDRQIAQKPVESPNPPPSEEKAHFLTPEEKRRTRLKKSKTVSCIDDELNSFDDEELKSPSLSDLPSVGTKIKRKLLTEINRRKSMESGTSGVTSHEESTKKENAKAQQASPKTGDSQEKQQESKIVLNDTELPYVECGQGICAELLDMKSKISKIDIKLPYDQQAAKSGGWIYCGLEREVVILRKVYEEGSPVQSYLGKGLIPCPPKTVFETLKNPRTRFTYDEMLKKMDILHEFSNGMKIVYWFHEVSQLFKRECRDFCVLQYEQMESNKYMIALRSIGWPGCQEKPEDASRATLHASGWIIEPAPKNNQLHSMVTYIVQMELGQGKINNGYMVEELAAKQPLSIAFLRQYLVPTSNIPRPMGSVTNRNKRYGSLTVDQPGSPENLGTTTLASLAAQFKESMDKPESLEEPPVRC